MILKLNMRFIDKIKLFTFKRKDVARKTVLYINSQKKH